MDFVEMIQMFSSPTAIIATYIVITLVKQYIKMDKKYYLLIAVVVGMAVVMLEEMLLDSVTVQKLIAGALSGIIAEMSYEAIHKIVTNKSKI